MKRANRKKLGRTDRPMLPELDQTKRSVLNSLTSLQSRRSYQHAMEEFIDWYCSEPRLALNRAVVLRYRLELEAKTLAAATINVRLAAVRRLAYEAADTGLLSPELVSGIRRVKGVPQLGRRVGNWLSAAEGEQLLSGFNAQTLRGKRDAAIISLLLGCGLRRSEVVALKYGDIQRREDRWAIVDLVGKAGHVRTVPVPGWVKSAVDTWTEGAPIVGGRLFRSIRKDGAVWGDGITQNVVWYVVKDCATRAGIKELAPHDLRRTCARLCHAAGGELEQIQFLLGRASVQTTERYVGCKQDLSRAVNDRLPFAAGPV
jgi:integrase